MERTDHTGIFDTVFTPVTQMLVPSYATPYGPLRPATVAVTVFVVGLIFDTVSEPRLVTQMLVPSNATPDGPLRPVMVAVTVFVDG